MLTAADRAGPHTPLLDPNPKPKIEKLGPKIAVFEAILSAPTTPAHVGNFFEVTKAVCLHSVTSVVKRGSKKGQKTPKKGSKTVKTDRATLPNPSLVTQNIVVKNSQKNQISMLALGTVSGPHGELPGEAITLSKNCQDDFHARGHRIFSAPLFVSTPTFPETQPRRIPDNLAS